MHDQQTRPSVRMNFRHTPKKHNKYDPSFKEIWDTFKKTNIRKHRIKGIEIKSKAIDNLFSEIRAENFPYPGK